jgi:hypothetical protein
LSSFALPDRDRVRYPNPHLAGEFGLDRRLIARRTVGRCSRRVGRRNQHRRKPVRGGPEFLAPAIDLPGADIGATGHH